MRRLKHLLWIVPLLLVAGVLTLTVLARNALQRDRQYHQALLASIQVSSDDFEDLQEIPARFTCSGDGISPQIEWSDGPAGTRSYALIATDWDAPSPSFRLLMVPHWILFDIPAVLHEIPRNVGVDELSAERVSVGAAMGGTMGYLPPCPPLGRHQYQFRVYALDMDSIEPASNARTDVLEAMDGHILAYGQLIGFHALE